MEPGSRRERKRLHVAVGQTFGKFQKGGGGSGYSFAPNGDYSAWALIETGIKQAVRWIYVEDQYMVSRMARKALLNKLKDESFEFLLILMTGSDGVAKEFKFLVTARNEFRRDLLAIDSAKKRWEMYTLKSSNRTTSFLRRPTFRPPRRQRPWKLPGQTSSIRTHVERMLPALSIWRTAPEQPLSKRGCGCSIRSVRSRVRRCRAASSRCPHARRYGSARRSGRACRTWP